TIHAGIVSPSGVEYRATGDESTPNDHFGSGPHGAHARPGIGDICYTGCDPTIGAKIVPAAGVQHGGTVVAAPDDHLSASQHVTTRSSSGRRISGARRYPTICPGVISSPRICGIGA